MGAAVEDIDAVLAIDGDRRHVLEEPAVRQAPPARGHAIGQLAAADVARVDRLAPELARTAQELRALGRQALTFEADVADHARAQEIVTSVHAAWGRIDFLLNNAGKSMPKPIVEITEEEFDRTIAIN